jgi:HAD superfamily hydrolase (TIGR01549 family)
VAADLERSRIRAVFFDLDDTLCDTSISRPERARLAFDCLGSDGFSLDFEAFFKAITSRDPVTGFTRGIEPALEELGLARTSVGARARGYWFFDGCIDLVRPYPLMVETMHQLCKDYRLGVITNGPVQVQRQKFDAIGVNECFEVFIASGEIGYHKPAIEIFRYALDRMGAEPGEAAMVGDFPELDVLGAQQAGMIGIWFNPEGKPPHASIVPDATVRSFGELPAILEALT